MNRMTGGSNDGFRSSSARCDGLLLVAVLALVLGPAAPGLGDADTWKEASDGSFHDGARWTDGSAPDLGDGACFDVPGTYTVSFFSNAQTNYHSVTQGDVTFEGYDGACYLSGGTVITGGSLTLGTSGKPLNLNSTAARLVVVGGGALNVESGSTVGSHSLFIGLAGETGTVVVDGSGSRLNEGGADHVSIGMEGTGSLTFQNSSTGNTISPTGLGRIFVGGYKGTGSLTVQSGSNLRLDMTFVGSWAEPGTSATVTVDGADSWIECLAMSDSSNDGSVFFGPYADTTATLDIRNGGKFIARKMWVYPTATVNLGIVGGGTLEVREEIIIDGGVLNGATAGALVFPNWGSMTLRNSGRASFSGDYALTSGTINVSGGSRLETTDGGSLTVGATVNVSGGGSTLTVGGDMTVGADGSNGRLSISDGVMATVGGAIHAASSGTSGDQATIEVRSGTSLQVGGDINLGTAGLPNQYARFCVDGSWVEQTGDSVLTVGANVGGDDSQGVLEVLQWGSRFTVGAGTVLNETGRIVIEGGQVDLKVLTFNGGYIDFRSGELSLIGDVTVGEDGVFDEGLLDLWDHELFVEGTVTIEPLAAVVVSSIVQTSGLETEALVIRGGLFLNKGWVRVNGGAGLTIGDGDPPGAMVTLGDDSVVLLEVAGPTTVNAGSLLTAQGGYFVSGSLTNSGSIVLANGITSIAGTVTVTAVGSLTVKGGSLAAASLVNAGTVVLDGTSTRVAALTNEATGMLLIGPTGGIYIDGAASNAGDVVLGGGAARLLGSSTLTNTGLIHGAGTIAKPVTNAAAGEIRAEDGKLLNLTGANGVNLGKISLQGGTAEFAQALTNNGDILGRGTLIAHGGLTNHGDIAFSGGITDAYGDMTNDTGGRVMVSGRADVTFWDDVHNAGVLFRVSADSSATFFGTYSGGDISGGGHVYFESDVTPGFSAAVIGIGGDVAFGPMANLKIELADSDNSDPLHPRYDALSVAGDVHLAGTLSLDWLPVPGDPSSKFGGVYNLVVYKGQRTGEFGEIVSALGAYLDGEVRYDVELGDGWKAVQITLHDLLDGDADLNGMVGYGDLLALFSGSHKGWSSGDFNFDGAVSASDYILLKTNFGRSVPISGSVSIPGSVPEPATLSLLALGSLALMRRRGRK